MARWWEDLVDGVSCPILHETRDQALACATDLVEATALGDTIWVRRVIRVRFVDMDDCLARQETI